MAAKRKQHAYGPLKEALSYCTYQCWVIHIFPWVVGIRGKIDPRHVESTENAVLNRKVRSNHVSTAQDSAGADSSACYTAEPKQPRSIPSKPHQTLPSQITGADEDGAPCTSASVPGQTHRASSTHRGLASIQRAAKRRASWQRPSKKRGMSAPV
jgi:hypothetical protein